jgi:peptidoglycan hydrolase CwlO-like protein
MEGPPVVYEEVMQQLEADVRKHIRIEHQLKLHIESVEERVEELEKDCEEMEVLINMLTPFEQKCKSLQSQIETNKKLFGQLKREKSAAETKNAEL